MVADFKEYVGKYRESLKNGDIYMTSEDYILAARGYLCSGYLTYAEDIYEEHLGDFLNNVPLNHMVEGAIWGRDNQNFEHSVKCFSIAINKLDSSDDRLIDLEKEILYLRDRKKLMSHRYLDDVASLFKMLRNKNKSK